MRWRLQVDSLARRERSQRLACLEHRQRHKRQRAVAGSLATVRRHPPHSSRNKGRQHQHRAVSLAMQRRSPSLLAVYSEELLRNRRQIRQTQQTQASLAVALQRRSNLLKQAAGFLATHSRRGLLQVLQPLASPKQSHLADFCTYHAEMDNAAASLTSPVAKVSNQHKQRTRFPRSRSTMTTCVRDPDSTTWRNRSKTRWR